MRRAGDPAVVRDRVHRLTVDLEQDRSAGDPAVEGGAERLNARDQQAFRDSLPPCTVAVEPARKVPSLVAKWLNQSAESGDQTTAGASPL